MIKSKLGEKDEYLFFLFDNGACLDSGPFEMEQVAQLKTAWAIHVILQIVLAEMEICIKRHGLAPSNSDKVHPTLVQAGIFHADPGSTGCAVPFARG